MLNEIQIFFIIRSHVKCELLTKREPYWKLDDESSSMKVEVNILLQSLCKDDLHRQCYQRCDELCDFETLFLVVNVETENVIQYKIQ